MARVPVTPQTIATTGTALSYTTIGADGVSLPFDGETWFEIKNDSGGALTPDISANFSAEGVALGVKSLGSLANNAARTHRPWKRTEFKQEDGTLWVNGSGLKIAAFKK